MAVRTRTLLGVLLTVSVVVSVVAIGSLAGGATQTGADAERELAATQAGSATFENGTVVEQRGDVAQFTVLFDGTDRATVTIGSPDVNYQVTFTIADGDGDGEATVRFNTAVVGLQADDKTGISADGADGTINYEMNVGPVPGPLDAATYNMELSVDGELTDVGAIVLNERATEDMAVWTAPGEASPNNTTALLDAVTQRDRVAQGDWAVLQVEASGLYGYVDNVSDLEDPDHGLNFTVTELPGRNRPEQLVDVDPARLLTDSTNDSLFVLVDTSDLNVTTDYEATFTINDSNPYVEEGESESASATFTVVERNVSFENLTAEGELELPAESDVTVSGDTSVAPGTVFEVQLRTFGAGAFLQSDQATVTDEGTWSVTFNLSEASDGTEFDLRIDDPSANVSGVIVEGAGEAETETPTNETETPTNETETPTDETETPEGEEMTPEGETETPADEETETPADEGTPMEEGDVEAEGTTTEADVSNVLVAGGVAGPSLGLVALLAAVAFVVLRRR